ncbi:MAG: helical backbone metal receptor [Victivallaceae bacterium]|nr:helical backbone metal receptor [Victivallaceae bacterium]
MRIILRIAAVVFTVGFAWAGSPPRAVSLSPAITELICKLGGLERLAGRSSACDYPAEVASLPVAGDFASPSVEKIAAIGPDMVVSDVFQDPEAVKLMKSWGIDVECLPLNSLDDYEKATSRLGELLDLKENAAKEVERTRAERKKLAAEPVANPVKVLLLFWDSPPVSCGKRSFLNDYLALAGGVSVTGEADEGYYYPSTEVLVQAAPEVVLCPETQGMTLENVRSWTTVPAVKNKRIHELNAADSQVVFRMSPRWVEAVAILKKLLAE